MCVLQGGVFDLGETVAYDQTVAMSQKKTVVNSMPSDETGKIHEDGGRNGSQAEETCQGDQRLNSTIFAWTKAK